VADWSGRGPIILYSSRLGPISMKPSSANFMSLQPSEQIRSGRSTWHLSVMSWPGLSRPPRSYLLRAQKRGVAGTSPATTPVWDPTPSKPPLYPEIPMLDIGCRGKLVRRSGPGDTAAFDDVVAIRDLDQRIDILVDDQDRLAASLERREAPPDFLADQRRQ